jgi:hypothetical protein
MGTHVYCHRLIGKEQLFRDYKAYWDCHGDALFISSIQARLSGYLRDGPCRWHAVARIAHGLSSHHFLSLPFFLVHGFVGLHHELTERGGALGIKPRRSNTE